MKTYTYGTTPTNIISAALPHKYSMELNRHDMGELLEILRYVSSISRGKRAEWSIEMRSSILETIGIEEV